MHRYSYVKAKVVTAAHDTYRYDRWSRGGCIVLPRTAVVQQG